MILVDDEAGADADGDDLTAGELEGIDSKLAVLRPVAEISLNSVAGITSPETLKLKGKIAKQEVVVLVDPEATHNFISQRLVAHLQLPVTKTEAYRVTLGTGSSVQGEGICQGLLLHLSDAKIIEDFLLLELGSIDVILGIQWLEKLSMVQTNWKTQVLKFRVGDQTITLRRDPSMGRSLVSLKSMMKTIWREGAGVIVEIHQKEVIKEDDSTTPKWLQPVLNKFPTIFESPTSLPPLRGHEPSITMQ